MILVPAPKIRRLLVVLPIFKPWILHAFVFNFMLSLRWMGNRQTERMPSTRGLVYWDELNKYDSSRARLSIAGFCLQERPQFVILTDMKKYFWRIIQELAPVGSCFGYLSTLSAENGFLPLILPSWDPTLAYSEAHSYRIGRWLQLALPGHITDIDPTTHWMLFCSHYLPCCV